MAWLNVTHVIAGHSERRAQCGETDEIVRSKVDAIYRYGMRPILCVGETPEERHHGAALAKVRWQVAAALAGRHAETVASAVIAYEPIWAIGAGETATPGDAGLRWSTDPFRGNRKGAGPPFRGNRKGAGPGGGISARYDVIALDNGSAPSVNVAVGLGGGDCGGR